MTKALWILGAAIAAALPVAAAGQATPAPATGEISKEQASELLTKCGTRQFQTSAEYMLDGKARRSGLTLCSAPGDTDDMWIAKLEKSAAAIAAQPKLPADAKTKLSSDLRNEIARIRSAQRRNLPAADALVANVPAMPAPLPPRPSIAVGTYVAPTLLAAPNITIRCLAEGGVRDRGEDCDGQIRRETVLALESGENMKTPATLRFVRKGELREEVQLGALRQGQLVRLKLPRSVCKGVVRSELQLEIVAGAKSAAATEGPYDLRC